jgi:two-component system LytT family response regulator
MIKCIVVDDQQEAIDVLKIHLKQIPSVSLDATFINPIEALQYIDDNKIDVLFLDVEMPNFSGIDFLENLKAKYGVKIPKIIFTTGHHEYAVAGFDKGVTDYLLKPVSLSRLKLSIDRLLTTTSILQALPPPNTFFFVESDNKKIRINFDEVIYVEAAGNYVSIATKGKKIMIHETLSAISKALPQNDFVRSHKSFVVSIANIKAVNGAELILGFEEKIKSIPIGATYKEAVMKKLGIA